MITYKKKHPSCGKNQSPVMQTDESVKTSSRKLKNVMLEQFFSFYTITLHTEEKLNLIQKNFWKPVCT